MTTVRPLPPAERALSRREVEVLRARCETGSRKRAAEVLGISEWAVGRVLRLMQERCGCADDAQACWVHHVEMAGRVG